MMEAVNSDYYQIIYGDLWINNADSGDYCKYCEMLIRRCTTYGLRLSINPSRKLAAVADRLISRWYFGEAP